MITAAELDILALILRTRAENSAQLAGYAKLPEEEVTPTLAGLAARGLIEYDGTTIGAVHPDRTLTGAIQRLVDDGLSQLTAQLDDARTLLHDLPRIMHSWELGESDEQTLKVDILHGPDAPEQLWRLQSSRGAPMFADGVLPDVRRLYGPVTGTQAEFIRLMGAKDKRARCILSTADASHPALQERLRANLDAGIQFRMHPDPPSWFWINDDQTVGIPVTWGEAWPTSVMAITHPSIAALLRHIFDRVWDESQPVGQPATSWDAILKLMAAGATMEAAGRALGLSERTCRRRVAEAMDHYGVHTLFSLGTRWHGEQD